MVNTEHLCMSCMKEIGLLKQCPHCGYFTDSPQSQPYLPVRSVIANRYLFGRLLDYNGEGATYIGWDLNRREPVYLREFFPDSIAVRSAQSARVTVMPGCERTYNECLQSYLELWSKLGRLRGLSALIHVTDIVEENNTAYAVSDYIEGCTLREYLLIKSKTGSFPWERVRQLLMPVLSAIGSLHSAGIIHRGISPTTLLVGQDGKVWLSGFSISQARTARGDLNAQLFPGYAAIEQYGFKGQQGSWTDIYAFAGVLYRAIIGSDPIEATLRASNDRLMVPGQFAEQIPAYVIHALVNAMQIRPEDRTRTVDLLRAELNASPSAAIAGEAYSRANSRQPTASTPVTRKAPAPKAPPKKTAANIRAQQKKTALRAALACLGVGIAVLGVLAAVFHDRFPSSSANQTTTAATTAPPVMEEVPNLINDRPYLTVMDDTALNERFTFKVIFTFSDRVESGYIMKQSIDAGKKVARGTEITLTVSQGKEQVVLPNFIGQTLDKSNADLNKFRYELRTVENDGSHKEGTVKDMNLSPGKSYPKGTELTIRVWGSPPTAPPKTNPPPPAIETEPNDYQPEP